MAFVGVVASLGVGIPAASGAAVAPSSYVNWPSYLLGSSHSSYQVAAKTITPANAASLTPLWSNSIGLLSSPTVYDGVIYIGATNGKFYAFNETTGAQIWSDSIGTVKGTTCGPRGFVSTATVATDPGTGLLTVYVASATGYVYAFNAANGLVVWKALVGVPSTTQNDYFNWASPVVANGTVYMGISSQCDTPLVRGGLISFNQETGAPVATWYTVPPGDVGGSIWGSPAVDSAGNVWVTTGNGPSANPLLGNSESIVKLNGETLHNEGSYQITNPHGVDSDFGTSPTLFSAVLPGQTTPTPLVGACNKNGSYYVLNRAHPAAGPVWEEQVGDPSGGGIPTECIASADWNGNDLFITTPQTLINGTKYWGTEEEVNPATGAVIWQTGLGGGTDGSATMDGAGVLAVSTWDTKSTMPQPSAAYLLNARTGRLLATYDQAPEFATPVFADGYLILATLNGMTVYTVPSSN
jgi:outer membrane protein assembly factor BamB